jgi:hypothetical protein
MLQITPLLVPRLLLLWVQVPLKILARPFRTTVPLSISSHLVKTSYLPGTLMTLFAPFRISRGIQRC